MILATVRASDKLRSYAAGKIGTILSLTILAVTLFWVNPEYGALESLVLFVPFACICFGATWFCLLTSRPILFLGRISYSLYLLHLLVLSTGGMLLRKFVDVSQLGAVANWLFASVCGAIAITLSAFSYQYLEHPFLHAGKEKQPGMNPQPSKATATADSHPEPSALISIGNVLT